MNMAGIVKFLHMIKSSLVFVLVESGCLAALFFMHPMLRLFPEHFYTHVHPANH